MTASRCRRYTLAILLCWIAAVSCRREVAEKKQPPRPAPKGPIQLTDVSQQVGLDFILHDGSGGRRYIIEPMCSGLALFDYDADGWIDIYLLSGAPLPGTKVEKTPRNRLFRNLGNWHFVDVTEQAGVGDPGFGLGVTVGDIDNDGFRDLYVNNVGPNALYRNNGDGTFQDVTRAAGVDCGDLVGAGTCFLDMDSDGDSDLYVANYLKFDIASHVQRSVNGIPSYPSPHDFLPVPDVLYRNNGDGSFSDVSEEAGIAKMAGTGMGMICADVDADGDTDVFVLNDVAENFLFRNDGSGHFEEVALLSALAYNGFGQQNASMGVDCGDLDNDGLDDFFMTSYQSELPVFYRNLGEGRFEDATQTTRAGLTVFPQVNWGVGTVDLDNDGDRDVFIANGHTEDNVEQYDTSTQYRARNTLLLNDGHAGFQDISANAGSGLQPVCSSRGTGFDDLDNDGDLDAVVQNSRQAPTVIRNDSPNENHFLQLILHGTDGTRDALGAKVRVMTAAGTTQVAEVHSGRGYQSHYGSRMHFGFGTQAGPLRVEVTWLNGSTDSLDNLAVDQTVHVVQTSTNR